jgi:hypothetical protein
VDTDPAAKVYAENALCFNCETGDVLMVDGGREAYPEGLKWFCGPSDIMIVYSDSVTILDWKTGDPFKAKDQLMEQGYAASRYVRGWTDATPLPHPALPVNKVRMLSVKVDLYTCQVSVGIGLEMSPNELGDEHDSVLDKSCHPSLPVIGEHCQKMYCPHRKHCIALNPLTIDTLAVPLMDDSELYKAWSASKVHEKTAEAEKEIVGKELAKRGGIQTSDGWLGLTYRTMFRQSASKLVEMARNLGVPEEEIAKCGSHNREPNGWRISKEKKQ